MKDCPISPILLITPINNSAALLRKFPMQNSAISPIAESADSL